ncbi:alkaline phosphatase family protein [Candidatus Villigracilis saccharophilus]|uniref:alkaline phosphatase family protein n=1 Tax=Candidatus Villigracilis saccharophilus TaxID=3140684 RepID=UPI003136C3C7|nr:alkaline phosphatase family protein [Anaerolineales bacterium]
MSRVILILSDALRYDVAVANMGFLGHLVESKLTSLYKIIGELPSMSRPMYETIHTGVPSSAHGIVANSIVRRSFMQNIFQSVSGAGRSTAAAAYYWISELYNRAPYDRIDDKEIDDGSLAIQHGRFYTEDDYPDIELFSLRRISSANFHLIIYCFTPWAWIITARPLVLIQRNIATMPFVRICGWRH